MVVSGLNVPVVVFIWGDESFNKEDIEPNLVSYYSVDGKQYAMPFNSSTPLLYYNKDAFKEAGLDPEKAPETFAQVLEYAESRGSQWQSRAGSFNSCSPSRACYTHKQTTAVPPTPLKWSLTKTALASTWSRPGKT